MTAPLFTNNASSRLFQNVDAVTTSIRCEAGDGTKFPNPTGGDWFMVTMEDRRTSQIEICKCTARSGDIMTVVRGQESTLAQAFAVGATVSHRFTAATMAYFITGIYDKATSDARFINAVGDTMTGPLVLPGDPVNPLEAADKAYVDAQVQSINGIAEPPNDGKDYARHYHAWTVTISKATYDAFVSSQASKDATQDSNIATNAANVATNTANIATNTTNITANAANIATNASNIAAIQTVNGNQDVSISNLQANKVNKGGDTMTGPLVVPGPPIAGGQAANKDYVDTKVPEAPTDGVSYVRKSSAWSPLSGSGVTVTTDDTAPTVAKDGDFWWDSVHGTLYIYYQDVDSSQWVQASGGGGGGGVVITTSDTAPANPIDGQIWWNSVVGQLFVYYDDGDSLQWVQANGMATASMIEPYPFATASMQLHSKSAGVIALNSKVDGTGTDVITMGSDGSLGASAISGTTITASGAINGTTITASSTIRSMNGRVIAQDGVASSQPSVSCYHAGRSTNYGMWNSTGNVLTFGSLDGNGVPTGTWANIASNNFTQQGSINATTQIMASTGIYAFGGDGGLYSGGSGRVMQFAANWYLDWNNANGTLIWIMSGQGAGWTLRNDKAFILTGNGWKPGGGPWADSSDERIKTVVGDYASGLDAILGLQPVRYTFKGNDTHEPPAVEQPMDPDAPRNEVMPTVPYWNSGHRDAALNGTEYIGLVAQATELVMPELVTKAEGYINGAPVTDLRNLDTGPLIFALINAVKTLASRVEALEARP